jgi:hypothetical protein
LILGIEAVLMHERLERPATAAPRAELREQLLGIALAAARSPERHGSHKRAPRR